LNRGHARRTIAPTQDTNYNSEQKYGSCLEMHHRQSSKRLMELSPSGEWFAEMHGLQFVSILNRIQMRLMKVIYMMKNMMNKELQHFVE
jgi:hypothetical protein